MVQITDRSKATLESYRRKTMEAAIAQCFGGFCFQRRKEKNILMVGLDSAGKTTILYQLKLGKYIMTSPTVGFNVETTELSKKKCLTVWDVSGERSVRHLCEYHFANSHGLMFVIDSTDVGRMEEARTELRHIICHRKTQHLPLVVLANKQDLPGALPVEELRERLELCRGKSAALTIHPVSAKTGDGIFKAVESLWYLMGLKSQNGS